MTNTFSKTLDSLDKERSTTPVNYSSNKLNFVSSERKENGSVKIFINEHINYNIQDDTEYIPPNYRTLPYKGKPSAPPHAYKMMNLRAKGSLGNEKKHLDDVIQIRNVNEEIKEDLRNTYEGFSGNKIVRPKTSITYTKMQRPFSRIKNKSSLYGKIIIFLQKF